MKTFWANLNPTFKRYLVSSTVTFLTAFLGVLAIQFNAGVPDNFSVAFVFSLVSVAARAGFKAVIEWLAAALQNTNTSQG